MLHSILATTPIASPLHPQAALPLLKGYLKPKGFNVKIIDTNILFYNWFLGSYKFDLDSDGFINNPLKVLGIYNEIEKKLWDKSQNYDGLSVGLRYLEMKYNRTRFDQVLLSLEDRRANPFIDFYEEIVERHYCDSGIGIAGISITFQDQIIPSFTLASILRKRLPSIKIVMGGQMITRCYSSMLANPEICRFFDYLALWEGEIPLLGIHEKIFRGKNVELENVIDLSASSWKINRNCATTTADEIPFSDFEDLDLNSYFLPDMLVPLQTTRGCYGRCEFCAIPYGANSYRIRHRDHVIEEILKIQEHTRIKYGRPATFFKFMEDTSNPQLLLDISLEVQRLGLDVKWETFARLEKRFTEKGMLRELFLGGCRKIHWGLESNDPEVLSNMKKKITTSYSTEILDLADEAGILNFCFILIGFPGETEEARKAMLRYIIERQSIHTITPTTFDLTRGAPMQLNFKENNAYGMTRQEAQDFEVRLPYWIHGENWKEQIVPKAHSLMLNVVRERPDIGFVSVFADQVRSMLCDRFGNRWGKELGARLGGSVVRELILNTEAYSEAYAQKREIDPSMLPEALRREHFRTKEDLYMISEAVLLRSSYEKKRFKQV